MFPNPQDALPLPKHPNLERYKKLAKELLKASKSADPAAIRHWANKWIDTLARNSGVKFTRQLPVAIPRWVDQVEEFATRRLAKETSRGHLADAQFVIARSHGFESWPKFSKHLTALTQNGSTVRRFEAAVDAIIAGDIKTILRLLDEDASLVRARSMREHRATLLHYVSANGVEGYRQKTPKNIVAITKLLLDAGADVDGEADVYGGGATTLGLAATSIHPNQAGVQNELIQVLLDHGARIDLKRAGGNQSSAVIAALDNGCGEAAVYLAQHGAQLTLRAAAGVGRLDLVRSHFNVDGTRKAKTTKKDVQSAFHYACGWGRNNVIRFLLDKGVDLSDGGTDGQTALHWAVIGGHLQTVKLLLKYDPPLESRNIYGGTVLGQTLWSAAHGGNPKTYSHIIKTLIAAGARVPPRHVPVNKTVDDLLRRYGSIPEPAWYWYGEKPAAT